MRGIAVLTAVFVFASAAPFVSPASAQGTASLEGLVCTNPYGAYPTGYYNESAAPCNYGQGLPDAVITLTRSGTLPSPAPGPLGPTTASATTDANGYYSITGISAGDYSYKVTRTGFQDATGSVSVAAGSMQDFSLTGKAVEAKGKVTDPDGGPVAKANIGLCCGEQGYISTTSGADGRYTASVQAGFWSFDLNAPGFQSAYQSLLVDGGDINFQLERIPPQDSRIAGTVLDQDGAPVPDARVAVYSYGAPCCYAYETMGASSDMAYSRPYYGGENYTFTDAQGRFSIGAYAGDNSFSVGKDGYAYHSRNVFTESGKTATADVELMKYPEKTAKVVGKVVDAKTGKGLGNVYVNLQSPQYGLYECSQPASSGDGSSGGGSSGSSGSVSATSTTAGTTTGGGFASSEPYYPESYDNGCAIKTKPDGTFEGMVSPGYAILSVSVDWYATCSESSSSDGSFTRSCGPEYYAFSISRMLAADDTTTFDVKMRSRPAPNAEVSGYVIDAESGDAIPGAQVSFNNQDTYGWGSASTDGDGSYALRLRSGYHTVSVWAEGHLRWEGVLDVPSGDTPFDITIEPGQEAGCCGYYGPYYGGYGGGGVAYAVAEDSSAHKSGAMAMSATSAPSAQGGGGGSNGFDSTGEQYQDLGGGLGPYDPAKRNAQLDEPSGGTPGIGLLAMLAAIGVVFVLRRRTH